MDNEQYRIAILDEDAEERELFVNYFEKQFKCYELPIISNIDELINEIRSEKIDAVAIDYKLMDHESSFKYNGDYFFKKLKDTLLDYPTFILTSDTERAKKESSKINPFYILDKGGMDLTNETLRLDVLNIVKNYKNKIQDNLSRLNELEKTRIKNGLTSPQENEYVELNNEIDRTIDQRSTIPRSYYSKETNEKLDDVINKAEKLLGKISEK